MITRITWPSFINSTNTIIIFFAFNYFVINHLMFSCSLSWNFIKFSPILVRFITTFNNVGFNWGTSIRFWWIPLKS
uniref:Candidate secreted effector n=1 Tax=Meloidogyne incognita TaxID=6306 RepID=A0A914N3W0_MELIC